MLINVFSDLKNDEMAMVKWSETESSTGSSSTEYMDGSSDESATTSSSDQETKTSQGATGG